MSPSRSRIASQVTPNTPICLPTNRPERHAQRDRLEQRVEAQARPATPGIGKAEYRDHRISDPGLDAVLQPVERRFGMVGQPGERGSGW
jgi:hypothetical protein